MSFGTLEITSHIGCPLKCICCPQDNLVTAYGKQKEKRMTLDTFKKCIDKVPKSVRIDFSGMAEPFMNRDNVEMLKYAIAVGHQTIIYSTFAYLKPQDVEEIIKLPVQKIVVHLPDVSEQMHIKITDNYIKNLNILKGFSRIEFITHDVLIPELQGLNLPITCQSYHTRAGNIEAPQTTVYKLGQIECSSCTDLLDHNVLLPSGDVVLCCMDYSLEEIIGNLLTDSYESLFTNEKMKSIKARQKCGDILCRKCIVSREVRK